jgi:uncharacterized protein YbcV (DUF1398 family)
MIYTNYDIVNPINNRPARSILSCQVTMKNRNGLRLRKTIDSNEHYKEYKDKNGVYYLVNLSEEI